MRRVVHWVLLFGVAGVASCGPPRVEDPSGILRGRAGGYLPSDVPHPDARYVPISPTDQDQVIEGSLEGGTRVLTAGMRLVNLPGGGVLSASEPLALAPLETLEVPTRMGGGFLYRMASTIYRSDSWLGHATPIFAAPSTQTIAGIAIGLDRIYVKLGSGAFLPIDPRTGAETDTGPLPKSPYVGALVALDGWRAVAIVDARGVVVTEDAGATWTPIELPMEPTTLAPNANGAVLVSGVEQGRGVSFFEVTSDGHVGRLTRPSESERSDADSRKPAPGPFGLRPIAAAIEDGWPLTDGTALVARDGVLGRIRTADGALVEVAEGAYPMRPSRCHPFSLAEKLAPKAFGFVCGEPRGRTELYSYDAAAGRLVPLRHFDTPRAAMSSGNGKIFVRGACAPDAVSDDVVPGQETYCVREHGDIFRDFVVRGEIGAERLVILADGRLVVVSPPQGGASQARLTILDHGDTKTVPIVFATDSAAASQAQRAESDMAVRALRSGAWLDGFEERREGVISGWVLSGTTAVGIAIKLDGSARHGEVVGDLGIPVLSGQYGMSWTGTSGHETLDGGMTWRAVIVPAALPRSAHANAALACGPIGCETAGWLRIGWGSHLVATGKPDDPATSASAPPQASLDLQCEPSPRAAPVGGPSGAIATASLPVSRALNWLPFYGVAPPKLADDEVGYGLEVSAVLNVPPKPTQFVSLGRESLGHFYSWGPRGFELAAKGRAIAEWVSPFETSKTLHVTQAGPIPQFIAEAVSNWSMTANQQPRFQPGGVIVSNDGAHALWLIQGRNAYTYPALGSAPAGGTLVLEADRGPTEVRRANGEALPAPDAAAYVAGRWYLATVNDAGDVPSTVVWEIESGVARELARLPRSVPAGTALTVGLAGSSDERALGVIINGQPSPERFQTQQLWVVPIELASGSVGEPVDLGPVDMTNAATACPAAPGGWMFAALWRNTLHLNRASREAISLTSALARFHLWPGHACVDRIATNDDIGVEALAAMARRTIGAPLDAASVDVTVAVDGGRRVLRCVP